MAGVAPRRCLGYAGARCAARIRTGSRCPACAAAHERTREANRAETRRTLEPWRALYATPAWRRARGQRLALDGGRCVDCGATRSVSVDHLVPLRILWTGATTLAAFVIAACDLDQLRTRCASCHATIEASRRRAG